MGRQIKEGLDYHPVYVDFEENDKISLLLSEHGMLGEIVLQRLWRSIYRNKGYYYEFGSDECLLLSRRIGYGLRSQEIMEVVEACLRRNIFSMKLYKTYGILTSRRIQEIYLNATVERIMVKIDIRYLLINLPKKSNIKVYNPDLSGDDRGRNAISPTVNGGEMPFLVGDSTDKSDKSADKYTKESKVKESIVNESKEEESEGAPPVTLFSKEYFKILIEERKEAFRGAVVSFQYKYETACLEKFFKKWSEYTPTGKRMRFERESTWQMDERINSWGEAWNEIESKKVKQSGNRMKSNIDAGTQALQELINEIR